MEAYWRPIWFEEALVTVLGAAYRRGLWLQPQSQLAWSSVSIFSVEVVSMVMQHSDALIVGMLGIPYLH